MDKVTIDKIIAEIHSKGSDDWERDIASEDAYVKLDDSMYCFHTVDNCDIEWRDEGKYQFQETVAEIVQIDTNWKTIEKSGVFLFQSVTRSGSYFSDYYYDYSEVIIVEKKVKIIPEHEVIVYE
jgi:hypothetical protein